MPLFETISSLFATNTMLTSGNNSEVNATSLLNSGVVSINSQPPQSKRPAGQRVQAAKPNPPGLTRRTASPPPTQKPAAKQPPPAPKPPAVVKAPANPQPPPPQQQQQKPPPQPPPPAQQQQQQQQQQNTPATPVAAAAAGPLVKGSSCTLPTGGGVVDQTLNCVAVGSSCTVPKQQCANNNGLPCVQQYRPGDTGQITSGGDCLPAGDSQTTGGGRSRRRR